MSEEEAEGGAPSMRDWRDLTSTLVSSCLIYFMTQHISRAHNWYDFNSPTYVYSTTKIPVMMVRCSSSRTQKLPTQHFSQTDPIEIQSDALYAALGSRLSTLCSGHSYKSRKQQTMIRVHFIRKSFAIFQPGAQIRVKLPPVPARPGPTPNASYAQCGMREPIKSQMRFF